MSNGWGHEHVVFGQITWSDERHNYDVLASLHPPWLRISHQQKWHIRQSFPQTLIKGFVKGNAER
jgi:hypothetical protein